MAANGSIDSDKPTPSVMRKLTERWNKQVKSLNPYASVRFEDVKTHFEAPAPKVPGKPRR